MVNVTRLFQTDSHLHAANRSPPGKRHDRCRRAGGEAWLRHVSYYRLSAYWLYFEHPKGQAGPRFLPGTTFERVTALYDFDRLLRRLLMRGITRFASG